MTTPEPMPRKVAQLIDRQGKSIDTNLHGLMITFATESNERYDNPATKEAFPASAPLDRLEKLVGIVAARIRDETAAADAERPPRPDGRPYDSERFSRQFLLEKQRHLAYGRAVHEALSHCDKADKLIERIRSERTGEPKRAVRKGGSISSYDSQQQATAARALERLQQVDADLKKAAVAIDTAAERSGLADVEKSRVLASNLLDYRRIDCVAAIATSAGQVQDEVYFEQARRPEHQSELASVLPEVLPFRLKQFYHDAQEHAKSSKVLNRCLKDYVAFAQADWSIDLRETAKKNAEKINFERLLSVMQQAELHISMVWSLLDGIPHEPVQSSGLMAQISALRSQVDNCRWQLQELDEDFTGQPASTLQCEIWEHVCRVLNDCRLEAAQLASDLPAQTEGHRFSADFPKLLKPLVKNLARAAQSASDKIAGLHMNMKGQPEVSGPELIDIGREARRRVLSHYEAFSRGDFMPHIEWTAEDLGIVQKPAAQQPPRPRGLSDAGPSPQELAERARQARDWSDTATRYGGNYTDKLLENIRQHGSVWNANTKLAGNELRDEILAGVQSRPMGWYNRVLQTAFKALNQPLATLKAQREEVDGLLSNAPPGANPAQVADLKRARAWLDDRLKTQGKRTDKLQKRFDATRNRINLLRDLNEFIEHPTWPRLKRLKRLGLIEVAEEEKPKRESAIDYKGRPRGEQYLHKRVLIARPTDDMLSLFSDTEEASAVAAALMQRNAYAHLHYDANGMLLALHLKDRRTAGEGEAYRTDTLESLFLREEMEAELALS